MSMNPAMKITENRTFRHPFTALHCAQSREMLGWSQADLARESGVSQNAVQRFESGDRLRDVTHLALAFRLEAEGLIFFPGFAPSIGSNIRGTTPNPMERSDFALIE